MRRRSRRPLQIALDVGATLAIAGAVHAWWNLRQLRVLPKQSPREGENSDDHPRVSVLIPARDEAGSIGQCLAALHEQVGDHILEIVVLDDRSSDGTADVVRHHLDDPKVRLIEAKDEPPDGWLGKTWACQQLSDVARGELLLFVDADVVLAPDAVARIAASMSTGEVDAICPYPRQVSNTWPERIVQPLLQWSWATFLPLRLAETSTRESLVAANGQVLAVTRDAYDTSGGHASIRGEVLDDVALFRQLKRSGHRPVLADGTDVASCRMYDDWPTLREGYSKSLWAATVSPGRSAALAGALSLAYVVPPVAALRGSRSGLVGYAAAVAGRAVVARRVGGRVWPDSLLHPVSIASFDYLLLRSWWGRRRGSLTWKGRYIDPDTT